MIPTVREDNREIWETYNPERKESATHKRFVEQTPDDSILVDMNWRDNPWFPDAFSYTLLRAPYTVLVFVCCLLLCLTKEVFFR